MNLSTILSSTALRTYSNVSLDVVQEMEKEAVHAVLDLDDPMHAMTGSLYDFAEVAFPSEDEGDESGYHATLWDAMIAKL
jgi:hypothetical protein